LRRNW